MNSFKQEITQHKTWLLFLGYRVEDINKLLVQSSRELPDNEEQSWLMLDKDRDKGELIYILILI